MRISSGDLRRFLMARPPPRRVGGFFRGLVLGGLALPLRTRILQRKLQSFDRRLRKNRAVVTQQMVRVNFVAMHQLDSVEIARAQRQITISMARDLDQQRRGFHLQRVQSLAELLGLGLFHIKRVAHDHLAVGKLRSQRRTQRAQHFLARENVIVGARLRSMHRAAMPPQRRADRADTGAAGALLLPKLFSGAGDQFLVLGGVRAGTLRGPVMLHRFPQQVFVDRAKYFIGEVERPDLVPAQIVNIDSCHMLSVCCCGPTTTGQRPTTALKPSSPPSWPPSTDQPWPRRQTRAALWAVSWLW